MLRTLIAQGLSNPAVPGLQEISGVGNSGERGARVLGFYIALMIQTSLVVGGLAVLLNMFLGAIGWITAGGDSGKIQKARDRILQSIIGLAVIFSVVAAATFLGPLFGLDLLRPVFINQLPESPSSGGGGGGGTLPGFEPDF